VTGRGRRFGSAARSENGVEMPDSKRIAGFIGPTLIALGSSEVKTFRIWESNTAPLIYLNGVLLFVAGLAILRVHKSLDVQLAGAGDSRGLDWHPRRSVPNVRPGSSTVRSKRSHDHRHCVRHGRDWAPSYLQSLWAAGAQTGTASEQDAESYGRRSRAGSHTSIVAPAGYAGIGRCPPLVRDACSLQARRRRHVPLNGRLRAGSG
jgi:hypothetical protein